jgi:hypothetical protein
MNACGMLAGLVGWIVCSSFASVGYGWTFYYAFALAVAGREVIMTRLSTVEIEAEAGAPAATAQLAGAHA